MKHMKMFQKLMEKKGQEENPLSDVEKEAKSSVIKSLQDHMSSLMGDKLDGLKKVTIASDSPEGLKEGLKKAQEIAGKMPGEKEEHEMLNDSEDGEDRDGDAFAGGSGEHDEESPEHEAQESPHEEAMEHGEEEPEDDHASIDAKIEELMKKKAALKNKGY